MAVMLLLTCFRTSAQKAAYSAIYKDLDKSEWRGLSGTLGPKDTIGEIIFNSSNLSSSDSIVCYSKAENDEIIKALSEWRQYKRVEAGNGLSVIAYAEENKRLKDSNQTLKDDIKAYAEALKSAKMYLFCKWRRFIKRLPEHLR